MPIYEYCCSQCGKEFEQLVFTDSEKVACPQCQATEVRKVLSVCAFSVGSNFKATAGSGCSSCTPSPTSCSTCGVKH